MRNNNCCHEDRYLVTISVPCRLILAPIGSPSGSGRLRAIATFIDWWSMQLYAYHQSRKLCHSTSHVLQLRTAFSKKNPTLLYVYVRHNILQPTRLLRASIMLRTSLFQTSPFFIQIDLLYILCKKIMCPPCWSLVYQHNKGIKINSLKNIDNLHCLLYPRIF